MSIHGFRSSPGSGGLVISITLKSASSMPCFCSFTFSGCPHLGGGTSDSAACSSPLQQQPIEDARADALDAADGAPTTVFPHHKSANVPVTRVPSLHETASPKMPWACMGSESVVRCTGDCGTKHETPAKLAVCRRLPSGGGGKPGASP